MASCVSKTIARDKCRQHGAGLFTQRYNATIMFPYMQITRATWNGKLDQLSSLEINWTTYRTNKPTFSQRLYLQVVPKARLERAVGYYDYGSYFESGGRQNGIRDEYNWNFLSSLAFRIVFHQNSSPNSSPYSFIIWPNDLNRS